MGVKSTDKSQKGFGSDKILNGHMLNFFSSQRTGGSRILEIGVSGGTVFTPGNGYKYHIFTGSGYFYINQPTVTQVDCLVIAGGGAGGAADGGGGGGAGGFRELTSQPISPGAYEVIVGGGGGGSPTAPLVTSGNPSSFLGISATGGGKGLSTGVAASPGGSGGGGGYSASPSNGATGNAGGYTPVEGYSGGNKISSYQGGGGGGAGGAGSSSAAPGNANYGGLGGAGRVAFSGDTGIPSSYGTSGPTAGRWFASGGSGASNDGVTYTPARGYGGGGSAAGAGTPTTSDGINNTGGGGGGLDFGSFPKSGNGGSGIVIIRYSI